MPGERLEALPESTTIRLVVSDEDKETVYRFRYQMHFLTAGKEYPGTDHARGIVADRLDSDPRTRLYASFDEEGNVTGTGRLLFAGGTLPPQESYLDYRMDLFPEEAVLRSVLIGGLLIHPAYRASELAWEFYEGTFREILARNCVLGFGHSVPKLYKYFNFMGYQAYGVELKSPTMGTRVAFVLNIGNIKYLTEIGSPYLPLLKEAIHPGLMEIADAIEASIKSQEGSHHAEHGVLCVTQ